MNNRDRERKEERKQRVPIGGRRTKLQLSEADMKKHKGYVLRWVNDVAGRVQDALAGGYEFVTPDGATSLGEGAIHEGNTDEGARVSKTVDKRIGTRAYLMRISEEWYQEDQEAKEQQLMAVDHALKGVKQGGQTIEEGYTPD